MEDRPITGLNELVKHLDVLAESDETPLDAKLFDDVELQLTEYNTPPLIPRLLPKLVGILTIYQQDPSVIVSLAIRLLKPVTFTQALSLASSDSLILALNSPAPSATILAMTVVEKAAAAPSDTAILSNMHGVIAAFIIAWLSSPSVEVGEKATKILGDLLDVDCDQISAATITTSLNDRPTPMIRQHAGQGLLWRRIFHDRDIYASLFDLCSLNTTQKPPFSLDERQKSLAQGRLLRILPRLALLDLATLTHSSFPDVEASYNLPRGSSGGSGAGLLHFAALQMVDKRDVLMHITLLDFFREFLDLMSMTDVSESTLATLIGLVGAAVQEDEALEQTLRGIAESPNTAPEMVALLQRLDAAR
ncbi:MAG: hypothetical protein M1818_000465 [Claussenomyces sp. TS43310]|nr:MAG: hypothetical protein M1818_000465 [Claussenomyces sp. TS43310]